MPTMLWAFAALFSVGSKSELRKLMCEIRPKLAADPYERMLDVERARKRLLEAVEDGRVDASEVPPAALQSLRQPVTLALTTKGARSAPVAPVRPARPAKGRQAH